MLARFRDTTNENALARRFGGGFDPAPYGTLALWLDAADASTLSLSSTTVTQWRDKSTLANHAAPVGSPVFAATGVNGKPSISLNGSSMGFRGALANTGTVSTTFIVATLNTSTSINGRLVSLAGNTGADYNNASFLIPLLRNGNAQELATYYNGSVRSVSSVPTYDTPFYATAVVNGTNNTTFMNGIAGTTSAMSPTFAITKYAVGTQPNANGDWWKGYVSEVLVYNSALSTPDRQTVEAYLATKWGI